MRGCCCPNLALFYLDSLSQSAHALFEYVEYRVPTLTTTALEVSAHCTICMKIKSFFKPTLSTLTHFVGH